MKLKKILALVLCFAMVLSTMSFTVSAEGIEDISVAEEPIIDEGEGESNVADVDGVEYATLENALQAIVSGSNVKLLSDIIIEENWDNRNSGGKISTPVTIDGNNKTIKVTGTVNDKNYDAFFRFESDATVNNLTMDFSESTDARIRAISAKAGSLTVENCTFIGRGSADNSRAIIFGEGGGAEGVASTTVSISGCTFNGWRRGVTDNENGQDAKSVSITGCKFTDASAYIRAYEDVVFSENTMDDGWVNVKSYSESEILTIVAENNTLEEDSNTHMNNIGGNAKAKIGNKYYASFKGAASAAVDGDIIELADGTYNMVSIGKDVTIKGSRDVIIDNIGAYGTHASLTFDGVTLDFMPNTNYTGFQHSDVMTYNNVKIVGQPFLYGNVETFNNCEFVQESADAYNVWTYGAKNVTFNGCTFESAGKAVLIYNESAGDTIVDVVDCELTASAPAEGKAAFEIHTKGGACYLTIDEETTATGFGTGSVSGNSLWNDKSTEKTDALNDVIVKVADEVVLARTEDATEKVVAIVDNELFDSLANAIKALDNDSTMIILEGEYDGDFNISSKTGVTVKAQGEVVINGKPSFGKDFDVSGINFVYPGSSGSINGYGKLTDCEFTGSNGFRWCYANGGNVVFKNSVITGSTYGIHFDGGNGNVIIDNCTITGWTSFGSALKKITISGSKFAEGNYNVLRFYQDAEISKTEFNPNSRIDAGNGGTGMTGIEIKVDNCTVSDGSDIMDRIPASVISASDVKIDGEIVGKIATVIDAEDNESYYETLAEAVVAAQDGDVIDLMGNTAEFTQANVGKALKITNGTITLPSALTRAATEPTYWFVSNDITFEDITLTGENYNTAGWGVFYLTKTDASVKFVNSTVNLKNDISEGGGFIKGDVAGVTASFDNTDVYLENTKRGFNDLASLTLFNDSDFVLKGTTEDGMENAINKAGLVTINDRSSIEIDGCFQYGIKMDNSVHVNDEAKVVVRNSGIADIMERENAGNPGLRVNDDAIVIADIITPEVWVITQGNGEVIEKSENIYVQFKKVDIDADDKDTVEGSDKYEIILSGYKHNINRLTTADLSFKLDAIPHANADMAYTIEPRAGITLTPHDKNGYMFNFDGVTAPDETGENITIGYVTISGYGEYNFSVAADNKNEGIENIVNATEVQDSIVDTFVIDGATDKGTLIINTTIENDNDMVGMIDGVKIAVPTRTLKLTIDFPNAVEDNAIAYQDMKVEITGNIDGVNKTVTYDLGKGAYAMENGSYVVEDANLVLNNAYTVTVSGAGYRTARYTVTMTEDKALRFWNNVMDEAQFVEIGKDNSAVKVTFLAGDIVKDNKINIYDLSAVVSYFGTETDTEAYDAYAKYDLNRDGVIDSKDVAYVLVSWNN